MSLTPSIRIPAMSEKMQYRLIYAAMFPFLLLETACRRAWQGGRKRPAEASQSIFAEARAANANALLLAFQG